MPVPVRVDRFASVREAVSVAGALAVSDLSSDVADMPAHRAPLVTSKPHINNQSQAQFQLEHQLPHLSTYFNRLLTLT